MKKIIGALLLSAMIAAPAVAQTAAPATPPRFVSVAPSSALTSNLIGLNLTNAGGETIGEIKDLVLAEDKGVQGFVVSVGGFLGIGEHYVVVDPSAVTVNYDSNEKKWLAKLDTTAEQLKAAPAFTYEGKWKS